MRKSRVLFVAAALLIGASGLVASSIAAQDAQPGKPAAAKGAGGRAVPGLQGMGGELVAALKASPGCLGVETGALQSGKYSIFAWFKDKAAVVEWYHSDYHYGAMSSMQAGAASAQKAAGGATPEAAPEAGVEESAEPLAFVPDDVGTILCIATITPSTQPQVAGFPAPIGQISIELYKPLPGGASFGGTFAPLTVTLEHHRGSRVAAPVPSAPGKAPAKSGG